MTHLSHRHRIITLAAAAALVVLSVGGVTWLLMSPGDDEPIAEVPAISSTAAQPAPTTPSARVPNGDLSEDARGDDGWNREQGIPLPPMNMPSSSLNWEQAELFSADASGYWLNQLFEMDDRLIASGASWDERTERETLFLFESSDGLAWNEIAVPDEFSAAGVHEIVPAGDLLVAFGNRWWDNGTSPELSVFVSPDAQTWKRVDVSAFAGDEERLWLWAAVGHDDTVILIGNLERFVDEPSWEYEPIIIRKNGLTLELDNLTYSFLITDDATGQVVLHGSQEFMWDHGRGEDGAVLYDPETGERIFSVSWEELNQRATEVYETTRFGRDLVVDVESGGLELRMDQYTQLITVTDPATQAVVFSGTEDVLWQGQPPTFIDPHTDTVILRLTWDEWNEAHDAAYTDEEGLGYWNRSIALVSHDDGESFTAVDLGTTAGEGFYLSSIAAGPDGFLAYGALEGPGTWEDGGGWEPEPVVLKSADGLAWTRLSTNLEPGTWIDYITRRDDGYLASGHTDTGPVLLESADGATWIPFLKLDDLGLPFGSAWFNQVATGELGTFVIGSRDGWDPYPEPEPMVTSKQGRTLTIAGPIYTLVDDATGETLFTFDEHEFWVEHGPFDGEELPSPVRWGQGGFAIFDDDGALLYALSHEEQGHEEEWEDPGEWYEPEHLLLRHDGSGWVSIDLPGDVGSYNWFSAGVVLDDRVVLAAAFEDEWTHRVIVFVGTE